MAAYILRRMLLMIPTLFGIMACPSRWSSSRRADPSSGSSRADRDGGDGALQRRRRRFSAAAMPDAGGDVFSKYRGAQGLDPEFITSSKSSSASTSRRSSASA